MKTYQADNTCLVKPSLNFATNLTPHICFTQQKLTGDRAKYKIKVKRWRVIHY